VHIDVLGALALMSHIQYLYAVQYGYMKCTVDALELTVMLYTLHPQVEIVVYPLMLHRYIQ
jgi:hypothetical protein